MSFLARGDRSPTTIAEGRVPRDMGVTNFSPGMFQAIARAGLEAPREGSFERTGGRRRGSKNRMAGQATNLTRSIEGGLQSGLGEGFLPEPRRTTTTVYSEGRGREMPRPKAKAKFAPPRPTPMTKEEFDKMPRRKTKLGPGMEDLIDRFPTQEDQMRDPKRGKVSRGIKRRGSRDKMRDPNAKPTVYNRRRRSRDEMRDPNAKPTVRSENIL